MSMFDNIRFPYFNLQQLNLDWLMTELKRIAGFMPQDGNVGDILTRKSDGAAWEQPSAVQVDIDGLPQDSQIMDNDQLIFYDVSAEANRKIKPPDLLNSMCSDAYPQMDGTASAGTSKKPARYDHIHPTDTSRAKASYFSSDKLKIVNGGTGASNAADARTNLGIVKAVAFAFSGGDASVTAFGHGVYDAVTGAVRLYLDARSTSDIATNTVLAVVPAEYRPTAVVNRATSVITNAAGSTFVYHCTIGTNGEIKQDLTSTAREIFMVYEYII